MNQVKNAVVKNRSFSTRFSLELAVSGLSKTILSATTIFMAGFLVSFGLTIPGLVQNVVGSYYKNVLYSNYYENRDLIGNAPLAKNSLSPTKEVDEYEKNLIDSKSIFGSGIINISKNVTDFAPIPDASAIPQILLSQNSSKELTAKLIYDSITNSASGQYNKLYQEQNSVISIIASLLGNNISKLVGKGISIEDMQKILEWTIHSNSNEFKNSTNSDEGIQKRIKKINDLSELLTNGLPQLLTNFIKGSSISEGEWKEQIIEIIIAQTPAYIKQYLAKSENRFNNFSLGWQINKYIPGVDNLYTNLLVSSKNNLNLNITGLQKTQNAYKISEKISNKVFINEYQSKILEKVLNDKPQEQISTKELESIKDIYNKETQELTIPVVANDQTDFVLNNDWNNLSNPLINKSRLVLRNGLVNIPNQAWIYDDGDWIRYNKNSQKNSTDNGYIEMQSLSPSKFTYAPIFDQTGFNLINEQKNRENINLMDNSYGFYNLTSIPTEKGEELNL
ncbi:hypothetical protein [Spiroplasma endosymbiont of Atherix ibis]|uniref:hypothetical protein n=1 Tax=Spiroplasma endosymbiont of Atherix ibis TaxID=3066291 RepID=UPI0030CDE59F